MTAAAALLTLAAMAVGAGLGWLARGRYSDGPSGGPNAAPAMPGEPMVTVTICSPARLYPPMVAGFGAEVQGLLIPGTLPAGSDPDDGIDEATGLPFRGPDAEQ